MADGGKECVLYVVKRFDRPDKTFTSYAAAKGFCDGWNAVSKVSAQIEQETFQPSGYSEIPRL